MRALLWLAMLWAVSSLVFGIGYELGLMGPTDEKAYVSFVANHRTPPTWYPSFQAPVYAIDVSLPIISLGERDKWQPLGQPVEPDVRWLEWARDLDLGTVGVGLAIWRWVAIVLGWEVARVRAPCVRGSVAAVRPSMADFSRSGDRANWLETCGLC